MTYILCKKVINNAIARGTLDKADMLTKLDTFLLVGRLTDEQYTELTGIVNAESEAV